MVHGRGCRFYILKLDDNVIGSLLLLGGDSLNGTVKIVLASRCRLVSCTPGSPQGGGVSGCCLGLHRLPPLLKLHRRRQAALFLSRSRSTQTNKSPLPPLSCSQHTRPRLLTCFIYLPSSFLFSNLIFILVLIAGRRCPLILSRSSFLLIVSPL